MKSIYQIRYTESRCESYIAKFISAFQSTDYYLVVLRVGHVGCCHRPEKFLR